MPNIKCVIFDCDGVLVDSEPIMISTLLQLGLAYGAEMELKEAIHTFSGRQIQEAIQLLEKRAKFPFPADFEQHFRKKAYEAFKQGILPVEGVEDILRMLQVPFCVASSGPREKIELNLSLTGLLSYFDASRIFSSYEINSWKPDPGIFLHAAAQMQQLPTDCVVIEDSLAGVQAARAGGFTVYALANNHNAAQLEEHGAHLFYHMQELPALLSL